MYLLVFSFESFKRFIFSYVVDSGGSTAVWKVPDVPSDVRHAGV